MLFRSLMVVDHKKILLIELGLMVVDHKKIVLNELGLMAVDHKKILLGDLGLMAADHMKKLLNVDLMEEGHMMDLWIVEEEHKEVLVVEEVVHIHLLEYLLIDAALEEEVDHK